MKLSKVFNQALFKTPKYNVFPQPNEVKFSAKIGKLLPVQYWLMNPGDSIDVNLQQLVRFAPLASPIMHRFQVDFQAIEIPDRLAIPTPSSVFGNVDGGFENFHNLNISDVDRPMMPFVTIQELMNFYVTRELNPIGSVFDFLGYPTFDDLYRALTTFGLFDYHYDAGFPSQEDDPVDPPAQNNAKSLRASADIVDTELAALSDYSQSFLYQGLEFAATTSEDVIDPILNFLAWLGIYKIFGTSTTVGTLCSKVGYEVTADAPIIWDDLINKTLEYLNLTAVKAMEEYTTYVFLRYLSIVYGQLKDLDDFPSPGQSKKYSLLPLYDYWSAVYDWFINTNIVQAPSKARWLNDIGLCMTPAGVGVGTWLRHYNYDTSSWEMSPLTVGVPFDRLWADDYFTSAFLEPAQGGNVAIPSGTIQDLRNASALQKLYEKLMYTGQRYIDQVLGIFGVHSSNERLDRCRVLGTAHFGVNVNEVTQTSQDSADSRLGDYSGQAIAVGQNGKFIHYQAEEHSVIMVFMSVRPIAVYSDVTPKALFKFSPYDFLIPELSHVGEQPIISDEILPSLGTAEATPTVFGYQRRYAEYMHTPSRICGEFRTSMDYWHAARQFDQVPTLNQEFISVKDTIDDINRIFAVPDANENLYCFLYFDTLISRPLSKFVEYHF